MHMLIHNMRNTNLSTFSPEIVDILSIFSAFFQLFFLINTLIHIFYPHYPLSFLAGILSNILISTIVIHIFIPILNYEFYSHFIQ